AMLLGACGGSSAPAASSSPGAAPSKPSPASPSPPPASPSAAAQLTPIKTSNIGVSGGVQPLWVAIEGGIFRKNGLDVGSDSLTTSSAATVAALVSGQIQVAWTDGTTAVNARAGGGDVTVIGTVHPAYSYLMEAAPEIKTP